MISSSRYYPRASPYHAAEELAAQAARLRRATRLLVVVGAVVLVLTVAAGVFLFNMAQSAGPASPQAPAADSPADDPSAASRDNGTIKGDRLIGPKEGKEDPTRQREALLEALGGLSAAHLYQSYLNIGLL